MSELFAIRDWFSKKKDPATAATTTTEGAMPADSAKKSHEKSGVEMTEAQEVKLRSMLMAANEAEKAGDLQKALDLYEQYLRIFLAIIRGESTAEMPELSELNTRLKDRFFALGIPAPELEMPVIPDLKPEHIKALEGVFGSGNLEPVVAPKKEDLTDQYFDIMYPREQTEKDTTAGLVSFRFSWWTEIADTSVVGPKEETWGDAYVRSIIAAVGDLQGKVYFTESIEKPNYKDGRLFYGSKEGRDASKDPLLPIIREVFGEDASRFNLTWDQIQTELVPKVREKIYPQLKATGIVPVPNFDVVITPAVISSLNTTLRHPENSETDTAEWSSTPLVKQDGSDSGSRLLVCDSNNGGASYVGDVHRDDSWNRWGFRLSVVFKT